MFQSSLRAEARKMLNKKFEEKPLSSAELLIWEQQTGPIQKSKNVERMMEDEELVVIDDSDSDEEDDGDDTDEASEAKTKRRKLTSKGRPPRKASTTRKLTKK